MLLKLLFVALTMFLYGCSSCYQSIIHDEYPRNDNDFDIREGVLSQTAQRIKYKRSGRLDAVIRITAPVIVAQAERELPWGFYQFPKIGKANDGTLIVTWQMKEDSHLTYGRASEVHYTPMISKDGGKTWRPQDKDYNKYVRGYNALLQDGGIIQVVTPPTKDIRAIQGFPKYIAKKGTKTYYKIEELPDEFKGVYLALTGADGRTERIHASLYDPQLLRYAIDDMMPIVWWGNIKELSDRTLVAGVYPTFYREEGSNVTLGGVSFYQSRDRGHNWSILSRIPFVHDGIAENRGGDSFDEPAFELLNDSTFICIMRTGPSSPMYTTQSYDKGCSWTTPKPFTPNGVFPQLLLLNNGVLVLVSGRPGIQLRFSFDGAGKEWTDPIEMIPFINEEGIYTRDVSCGYASIIEGNSKNSFYLVYSDFTQKNNQGDSRKAIMFRKVIVKRR